MSIEQNERRKSKTLTAAKVNGNLEPGKYHDGGGTGLFLRVENNGSRRWLQRTTIKGKRREIGLGSPPNISLADARELASQNKVMIRAGLDPLVEKKQNIPTINFAEAVDLYLETKADGLKNEKHKKQVKTTLYKYANPIIGRLPVDQITVNDVLKVLKPIWTSKTETASRVRQRIEAVLTWARVTGHCEGENTARWKGNISELLPMPSRIKEKRHHPALQLKDAQRWWADLSQRDALGAQALKFVALNGSRSGEVRSMTWDELELGPEETSLDTGSRDSATLAMWIIPASKMLKTGKQHRIALTSESVAILRKQPRMKGCNLVFSSAKGSQISDMTLSNTMRRMHLKDKEQTGHGYIDPDMNKPAVPHGLRSTFRDWAAKNGYDRDISEIQISHTVGNAVERAYRRTDMVRLRLSMMEAWGRFLRGEN